MAVTFYRPPTSLKVLLATTLLLAAALFSLSSGGRSDIGISDFWSTESSIRSVLFDIRAPRTLSAALLGINLGLCGLVLQAITRNPLASPSILGINQGAALGLTVAIILPGIVLPPDLMALLGALFAAGITFAIAGGFRGNLDSMRLILGGVAVGAFAYATVRFSYTLEDDLARTVVRWTVGDIGDIRWPQTQRLMIWAALGLPACLLLSHRLNLMALGQASAQGLGADPRLTLLLGTVLAAALAGVCVSVAGPIAFAGLIVPHLARLLFNNDHRVLVPATATLGATLMLFADGLSKVVTAPLETPLGVVVALIGAPWFLWLAIRQREIT